MRDQLVSCLCPTLYGQCISECQNQLLVKQTHVLAHKKSLERQVTLYRHNILTLRQLVVTLNTWYSSLNDSLWYELSSIKNKWFCMTYHTSDKLRTTRHKCNSNSVLTISVHNINILCNNFNLNIKNNYNFRFHGAFKFSFCKEKKLHKHFWIFLIVTGKIHNFQKKSLSSSVLHAYNSRNFG